MIFIMKKYYANDHASFYTETTLVLENFSFEAVRHYQKLAVFFQKPAKFWYKKNTIF